MRSTEPNDRLSRVLLFVLLPLFIACGSNHPASAEDAIIGSVRDADTNEPISGAWIFEIVRKPGSGADVFHVARARSARSDAQGEFRFEAEADRFSFGRRYPPSYLFYHPSYGLVRARAEPDGRTVTLRPSLRDAHLRQVDARAFCGTRPPPDAMAEKIVELACPPARPDRFPNGSPRATGALDERGRRVGDWTFFREDGSVIARGEYRTGAAVGRWQFESPKPTSPRTD